MKKEIKEKWVAALRSGEYKQGKDYLKTDDNCFCCLGVLTDLYIKDHPEYNWEQNENSWDKEFLFCSGGDNYEDGVLSTCVMNWAELESNNPKVNGFQIDSQSNLNNTPISELNDNYLHDFDMLADIIEEQL